MYEYTVYSGESPGTRYTCVNMCSTKVTRVYTGSKSNKQVLSRLLNKFAITGHIKSHCMHRNRKLESVLC